ncbi:hypothetical protein Daesc_009724 [Daldinia eschscholtzii]|uniref:Uncharacterized protein n=1 Tax=Daldinia eschscholtzii TaxID=292717 RepID=A0AAX6MBT1_9PEZI
MTDVTKPTILRPKMCDIEATVGCITVEARRKLVPDQNACKAVPPSSALIIGSAVGKLVDSIATAATIVNNDVNARRNCFVGLQPSPPGLIDVLSFDNAATPEAAVDASTGGEFGVISIVAGALVRKRWE